MTMLQDFLQKKSRGKKGEGRATKYRPINLPVEVLEDLRLMKDIYEVVYAEKKDQSGYPIPIEITYGQLLSYWMEQVELFDPAVSREFRDNKKRWAELPESCPVDPTEGDIWEMSYSFINRSGDEIEAVLGEDGHFYANYQGLKVSVANMMLNDWDFINEAGIEIDAEQADKVARKIMRHNKKSKK